MATTALNGRLRLLAKDSEPLAAEFAEAVREGLTGTPKRVPCRFFYDEEGSRLFEAICHLLEYDLTRVEGAILAARAPEIVAAVPGLATLAELGSGSAVKTRLLIEAILARRPTLRYVPVDISLSALEASAVGLLEDYPGLTITAYACEYAEGIARLARENGGAKLVLWLGSNVGNLERDAAAAFLRKLAGALAPIDRVLMGVDLRKDRRSLERAYDDAAGVTAQFNKNLLVRINRELGGHFDLARFKHRALYREDVGRVEMHLVSTRRQTVAIDRLGIEVPFEKGESIHTESSYKYSLPEIDALARASGMDVRARWLDERSRFSVNLLARAGS